MNNELKMIKNKYGEDMMHLCRRLFPTILEYEGLLFKLLSDNFDYSKSLYDDIINSNMADEFKNYIFCLAKLNTKYKDNYEYKTPKELLSEVGYDLYECKTEDDIDSFAKYYVPGERLCTFGSDRLKSSYVFFAVKKDVDSIKREDFDSPAREDKYGTSVISIQFTKGIVNTLGIMNRYNHVVPKADATFSNNLDNIVPGLTKAFEKEYNLIINSNVNGFDIPNYVSTIDGKFYKYNFEKNGIYYCPNNVIIDSRYKAHKYDKEKYIIMDDYIIDLVNKKISLFDENIKDSFLDGFKDIKRIKVFNDKEKEIKKIIIDDDIILEINKDNRLISYTNPYVGILDNSFINYKNDSIIENLNMPNVLEVGEDFFYDNKTLKTIRLDNVRNIEDGFLRKNKCLESIYAPNVLLIGDSFLPNNNAIRSINFPNVIEIGGDFLASNRDLESIKLDNVKIVGVKFLGSNNTIKELYLPKVEEIKEAFMKYNNSVRKAILPNVKKISSDFFYSNENLEELYIPNVRTIFNSFLRYNNLISEIDAPLLNYVGNYFMEHNCKIYKIDFPNLIRIGNNFLCGDYILESASMPNLVDTNYGFLKSSLFLKHLYLPNISEKSLNNIDDVIKGKIGDKESSKKLIRRR
jgi:hypothetical protein